MNREGLVQSSVLTELGMALHADGDDNKLHIAPLDTTRRWTTTWTRVSSSGSTICKIWLPDSRPGITSTSPVFQDLSKFVYPNSLSTKMPFDWEDGRIWGSRQCFVNMISSWFFSVFHFVLGFYFSHYVFDLQHSRILWELLDELDDMISPFSKSSKKVDAGEPSLTYQCFFRSVID